MKILHFVRCFTDDCGAYYYLSKLNKGLLKYGVQQFFLAYESMEYYKNSLDTEKVPVIGEVDIEKFVCESINPDIIHFHDNFSYYIQSNKEDFRQFYKLCEDRIRIRTIHDYSQAVCPNYLSENHGECRGVLMSNCVDQGCIKDEIYNEYLKYLDDIKNYNGITVFSDDTLKKLIKQGFDKEKLFKMPPLLLKPDQFSVTDSNIILFAGRIVTQKGIDYLLESVAKMKTKDWRVVIAGKGDLNYIKKLIKLATKYDIQDKLEFTGHLSQKELSKIYMKSKIMAFPSISHETYGFSGGEAISYGIPVVAFEVDGINEWLTHGYNGFMVPLMDCTAMAETMDSLFSDHGLYESIRNNCCQWSNNLDYEKQLESMYNYYSSFFNS